jgi:hypothetical protein
MPRLDSAEVTAPGSEGRVQSALNVRVTVAKRSGSAMVIVPPPAPMLQEDDAHRLVAVATTCDFAVPPDTLRPMLSCGSTAIPMLVPRLPTPAAASDAARSGWLGSMPPRTLVVTVLAVTVATPGEPNCTLVSTLSALDLGMPGAPGGPYTTGDTCCARTVPTGVEMLAGRPTPLHACAVPLLCWPG